MSERWLPINFFFSRAGASVRWIEFGAKPLSEPFFNQTLKALRSGQAAERTTDIRTLIETANHLPPVRPSGVIFHVSRCGSTLLANALRLNREVVLLAEAMSIGQMLMPGIFQRSLLAKENWEDARQKLARSVVTLYAHSQGADEPHLIIKSQAISMLQIALARKLWPEAPFLIMIRDPLEVMISNFSKPGAWVRCRSDISRASMFFGWTKAEVQGMSLEEYCARAIGRFCEEAIKAKDQNSRVIDYRDLNARNIYSIAEWFNIRLPFPDAPAFTELMASYSKDIRKQRRFEVDGETKKAVATQSAREVADRWAETPYSRLRGTADWVDYPKNSLRH